MDQSRDDKTPIIALDSEEMNANEVLFGDAQISIPTPDARPFNNLAEYYSKTFGKQNEARFERKLSERLAEAESFSSEVRLANFSKIMLRPPHKTNDDDDENENLVIEGKNLSENRRPKREKSKSQISVIERMEQLSYGPLSVLYRSLQQTIRVLIRRRRIAALRGERFAWITGRLVAFDRHLNLAIQDAVERFSHTHYARQDCGQNDEKGEVKSVPQVCVVNIRKRIKQMLIRGDNVILVARVDSIKPD